MKRLCSLALLLAAALPLLSGCGLHHSWSWKQADLDRNRFDLGLYRGADSAVSLATWTRYGEVVSATGRSSRGHGGDLSLVVRYSQGESGWFGTSGSEEVEEHCYRFTTPDGYDVAFRRTACP